VRPASHKTSARAGTLFLLVGLLLVLSAGDAHAWWNSDWSYRRQITIDPAAVQGGLQGEPGRFPLLVRLHDGNFKFSDAKDDGSDIRFIDGDDKTPLKSHIERYDGVFDIGIVWVDLPTLKPGPPTTVYLYYGNPKAPAADDPAGTYGPGHVLIYHFAEKGLPPHDSTAYRNNGTVPAAPVDSALIGSGIRFDGASALPLPAGLSLSVPVGGAWTWSAWIKPADIGGSQLLYARHDTTGALSIGLAQGKPYVSVTGSNAAATRVDASAPITAAAWHHVAEAAGNGQVLLYVDGRPVGTASASLPMLGGPASLGGDAAPTPAPADGATPAGFAGDMDELDIANTMRSAGFIQAQFATQNGDSKLLRFGDAEENSTWVSGYFVIILKSVTLDGWVIIGVLMLMAVASWLIMFNRARHISAVGRTNSAFLRAYRQVRGDLMGFEHKVNHVGPDSFQPKQQALIRQSPLHRLFESGIEELRDRISGDGTQVLTSQAIQAIRAAVDATYVREHQSINRLMVLLTIAISGGPFIGLLGTVVGVMITFASIAASGDVNINAIAPGIAAALVATVAGLFVAIPALFGYNYLLSRVKEETAAMQVFIDMFIARLAELYDKPAKLRGIIEE
jgi:biopolymer transport protein ExbB